MVSSVLATGHMAGRKPEPVAIMRCLGSI